MSIEPKAEFESRLRENPAAISRSLTEGYDKYGIFNHWPDRRLRR